MVRFDRVATRLSLALSIGLVTMFSQTMFSQAMFSQAMFFQAMFSQAIFAQEVRARNFMACRLARASDALREDWLRRPLPRGRRHYDVPNDHFTRYELGLMREQLSAVTHLEVVEGISLAWGMPGWTRWVGRLPAATAQRSLATLDWLARQIPSLADVVVLAGRPRQSPTTSS